MFFCCTLLLNSFINSITDFNILGTTAKVFLSAVGIYTEEVKSVEFKSDNYDESGSWKINKSAKWIDKNKIQITFDVSSIIDTYNKNKDIVLLLDTSGSMFGDKLNEVKSNSIGLLDTLLENDTNKISLITFNSSSEIIQEFTNDKDLLIEKINLLTAEGGTNYNAALLNLDKLLDSYVKEDGKDLVVMFLTDGYPVEENPSQVATYNILKSKYEYLTINGVQYEMGSSLKSEIKEVTDRQWIANTSTLNNVLLDVLVSSKIYDKFEIVDYISKYFSIENVNDISVSNGTVILEVEDEVQKVVWNLNKTYMTGSNATMSIVASLNSEYHDNSGLYPTNQKTMVNYKLPNLDENVFDDDDTPVLSNTYNVQYKLNTPEGCSLSEIDDKDYFVYSNVNILNTNLSCDGYLFKGFEIVNDNVKRVNDNVFIMPGEDVVISALWTKQSLIKSMNGQVKEKTTLYKVLEDQATLGTIAKQYTGTHKDSYTEEADSNIYYFYANNSTTASSVLNKNNVIFADHCWQMIRTTDTGGVKIIYNGEVDSDGKCGTNRGTHVGYSGRSSQSLNSNYYYGTNYTYNFSTKTFKLDGTKKLVKWDATVGPTLIGQYTCKSSNEDGTCSTLYLIESYNSASQANVITLNSSSNYSQFGTLQFNYSSNSPAYVGYMYGTPYVYGQTNGTTSQNFTTKQTMLSNSSLATTYWYSDSMDYGATVSNRYSLNNAYQVSSTDEYPNLVGKYTFRNQSETYNNTSIQYIAYVNGTTMYYRQLSNGQTLDSVSPIVFGDSITENDDGTFTINNPVSVALTDWYTNYASYNNKYTCNGNITTCASPRYLTATSKTDYTYLIASEKILVSKGRNGTTLIDTLLVRKDELIKNRANYSDYKYTCNTTSEICSESSLRMITSYSTTGYSYAVNRYFGSSVTYEDGKYKLVDPLEIESVTNLDDISTHHYICVTAGLKECDTVGYVYYYGGSSSMYYITLKNGELSVNEALDKMFKENTTNSIIKSGIDAWYEKYLLDYSNYLEDTIFCNDRSYSNMGGWKENGGKTNNYLYFVSNNLSCTNETDQFSVSNSKAKLKYPIGLATSPEMNLLNNATIRKTGQWYWLASPLYFYGSTAYERGVYYNGDIDDFNVDYAGGVRPVVSLISGTEYVSGDGSMDNPFVVE